MARPPPAPSLPLGGCLLLCAVCFLLGRWTQPPQGSQAGRPVRHLIEQVSGSSGAVQQAQAFPQGQAKSSIAAAPGHAMPQGSSLNLSRSNGLLDAGELERLLLQHSGLVTHRPPVKPAASGNDFYSVIPFQILSWYPRMVLLPNFLDFARCQHIIKLAKAQMAPSGLAWRPGEKHDTQQQTRTSSGTFLQSSSDPEGVLRWVEEKIAAATLLPPQHGEAFNVLRYEHNQHYDSHMDTFDPKDFGAQPSQRMITVLLYLEAPEEGGETVFKQEGKDGGNRPISDWRTCNDNAYKYKPRQGDAVLFYSLTTDLQIDRRALHGGCPIKAGSKWVATKWLHDKPLH